SAPRTPWLGWLVDGAIAVRDGRLDAAGPLLARVIDDIRAGSALRAVAHLHAARIADARGDAPDAARHRAAAAQLAAPDPAAPPPPPRLAARRRPPPPHRPTSPEPPCPHSPPSNAPSSSAPASSRSASSPRPPPTPIAPSSTRGPTSRCSATPASWA